MRRELEMRVRFVRRVARRVPITDVYTLPEAERVLNVGLLHAAPEIDVAEIQHGAWKRFIDKRRPQ
jgi:hypothetical protein